MLKRIVSMSVIVLSAGLLAAGTATAVAPKPPSADAAVAIRNCIDVANRDVGRGDTGDYVREVQCLLNWAVNPNTYHIIAVDGRFGPDTEGKVILFQRCANGHGAGLAVDGRVGKNTAPVLEFWAASDFYVC
jgi:lysozyme